MTKIDQDALEHRIDVEGLGPVLDIIATICGEKAEHLRSNWQDEASARMWDKSAELLEKLIHRLPV